MLYSSAFTAPTAQNDTALRWQTDNRENVVYEVVCRAAREDDGVVRNWSLSQLDEAPFKERLAGAFEGYQPPKIFAPTVDRMSGKVLAQTRFTSIFPLNRFMEVRRPGFKQDSDERMPCDSTDLQPRDAFAMSAGGCPLIVLTGESYLPKRRPLCIVAHAGRDSLIDHKFVRHGIPSRTHFSIVDAMVAFAKKRNVETQDMTLRSFFAIPWQRFPHDIAHEEYGRHNHVLQAYFRTFGDAFRTDPTSQEVCLDLSELIRWQAMYAGVRHVETGLLNLPIDGNYAYTTHRDPELSGLVRNLVSVVRH